MNPPFRMESTEPYLRARDSVAAFLDPRIAVLVSGSGTNLQVLLDDPLIDSHIVLVLSDRPGVKASNARKPAGLPT